MSNRPNTLLRPHKDQNTYMALLKSHILGPYPPTPSSVHSLTLHPDLLPNAYPRHSSTNDLKGFTIRVTINKTFYAAIAVAELGLPPSLMDPFEGDVYETMVLEDEFVEARNVESAVAALEMLCEEVESLAEGEGKGMLLCDEGVEGSVEFRSDTDENSVEFGERADEGAFLW